MAIYEYRCEADGAFDLMLPIGTQPATSACPVCGAEARRAFSKPMLRSSTPRELVAAVDRAEKSRHEPEVVTSIPRLPPQKRTPTVPLTPTLRRLPRP